ncbi:SAM-dependent methyltransferase, partial [Mycobacterium kansasii]
ERAALWAKAIASDLPDGGTGAFLAWGDPSLYDSTLRILDAILVDDPAAFEYDVVPGITAISALTARHRIVLNGIGEPVLITTGRRLLDEWPRA